MHLQRRDFLLMVTLAVAAVTPASAQTVAPTAGPAAHGGTQGSSSIPDLSGIWTHSIPGFEPLASGRWSTGRAGRTAPATFSSLSAITPIRS
jgi:hypothetical protein